MLLCIIMPMRLPVRVRVCRAGGTGRSRQVGIRGFLRNRQVLLWLNKQCLLRRHEGKIYNRIYHSHLLYLQVLMPAARFSFQDGQAGFQDIPVYFQFFQLVLYRAMLYANLQVVIPADSY